jgi:tetratricopeptide (TPR) repeat protein
MTSEFGKWIRRLVESFGDTKKAAHFAEVEHVIVRQLIEPVANPAENPVTSGSVPASSAAGPGSQTPKQISIFAQDMSFVNRGIQAFNKLELEKAVDLFQKHSSHYPKGYDISPWLKAAEFLLNGTSEAPHEPGKCLPYLCRLWDSFEDYLKSEQMDPDVFAAGAKSSYFARLFHEVERAGLAGSSILPENIPIGYVLLQAGQCEEAIRSLQECIPKMPQSAALYGWLGDAYLLRGELAVARRCYMEACFLGPAAIDWRHFRDAELKRLKEDILLYYGFELESALEWLPSHARIEGLFERKVVRVNDGLKEMVDDYLAMEKAWSKENSTRFAAKLFFRGMVLSENLENLKFIKKIDPIQVRRTMKQANPDLFEQFLEMVVGVKR